MPAVMALVHRVDATHAESCSGTTIATGGGWGFLLTAAHCVVEEDAASAPVLPLKLLPTTVLRVVPGPNWLTTYNTQYFEVAALSVHPSWDGLAGNFDVAVVRYRGATASTPAIPILAPGEGTLALGAAVTLVGYGETETSTQNTQRNKVDRVVSALEPELVFYSQSDGKGSCFGDSGGPALFAASGGVRVAGVMSRVFPDCTTLGAAARMSASAAFVNAVIAAAGGGTDGGVADARPPDDAAADASSDVRPPSDAAVVDSASPIDSGATSDGPGVSDAPPRVDVPGADAATAVDRRL